MILSNTVRTGKGGESVQAVSVSSNEAVLPRKPVVERRHLGRVLCGLMCPLRSTPSESAAAGAAQLHCGPKGTNEQ